MECSHRVDVAFIGLEFDDNYSIFRLNQFQTEEAVDGRGKVPFLNITFAYECNE